MWASTHMDCPQDATNVHLPPKCSDRTVIYIYVDFTSFEPGLSTGNLWHMIVKTEDLVNLEASFHIGLSYGKELSGL